MTKVTKILYATSEESEDNEAWVFNYYLTKSHQDGNIYVGIMITSRSESKYYENSISGIFPYKHDAERLMKYLYDNHASPISMPYLASEFIENNFLSETIKAIDLTAN